MRKICNLFFLISLMVLADGCSQKKNTEPLSLDVMSFNIWVGGGKSITSTARVINESGADIIGIQEATNNGRNVAVAIADSLGWNSYTYSHTAVILSKYPIIDTSANKCGVKIEIDENHFVWMFNVHLIHCPYEPYQLNNIEYCGAPFLTTETEAIASATASRGEEVDKVISDIIEVQKQGYPVFLTGDFNEPSALDWTARAVEADLCKIPVAWPSTTSFMEKCGLRDSYRTIYPDEVGKPGHTWTTLPETQAYEEVLDRIDFVLFSGNNNIKATDSRLVGEAGPHSDIHFDDYPSDHRAVLSSFILP